MWYPYIVFAVTLGLFSLSGLLWPADRSWYASLSKPVWSPPAKWNGIAQVVLYALLAASVAMVYVKSDSFQDIAPVWIIALFANYGCNQAYHYFEFHQKKLFAGFLASFAVAASACLLLIETIPYSKLAAGLIMPYLLWSCFAALLPWTIFTLNRDDAEA
ncbi:TspO/MBR family protein [Paenibacillus ginsengarvi]|uniref:Tryptophan-rich sensory protein n=1 Tax=Paenibacillus ginsengarvi TaxID=400777 RepID=A0A3B0CWU7_9BACL|nr:tryptophan-rich sensory protein [Paenibacillus ginsengarvi]RKN86436.1 tryptophan-rich sensory protein [Paenibacillus ginsengarvi]